MFPQGVSAPLIEHVFEAYDRVRSKEIADLADSVGLRPAPYRLIYCDASALTGAQVPDGVARLEQRRDVPGSRTKWRFGLRSEALLRTAPGQEEVLRSSRGEALAAIAQTSAPALATGLPPRPPADGWPSGHQRRLPLCASRSSRVTVE
jgi:hypothetical protein